VEYRLSSILPAPVTPGETVTAFGVFPADVTVLLDGQPVSSLAVRDGLRFTVPQGAVARDAVVELRGTAMNLRGSLSVNPRVDAAALSGSSLTVSGAGWTGAVAVALKVNGASLPFTPSGSVLTATLPPSTAFGLLSVTVEVGKRSSNAKGVPLEAGAISGRVTLPIPTVPLLASRAGLARTQAINEAPRAFLVIGNAKMARENVTGALEIKALVGLNATRFAFNDAVAAQTAYATLSHRLPLPGVTGLEWDAVVRVSDAGEVIPQPAPRTSSRMSSGVARTQGNPLPGSPLEPPAEQWFLGLQGIPNAWAVTRGAGVTVAVVDTGVNLEHPDLIPNLLPGYDFVDGDTLPMDLAGHGTHVAGLVAAHGLALGVAPEAKILPVRVLRDLSGGSVSTVVQGILWAANLLPELPNPNPAQIINLSLGSSEYSALLESAVRRVEAAGVLVVAAAGNSGGALSYPAGFDGVVAVTALAGPRGGDLLYQPYYASRGAGLWITAFGGDSGQDQDGNGTPDGIYSTDLTDSGYGLRMGTSMAAPQVAGLAALARAGGSSMALLRELIGRTASDLGVRGYDLQFGYGLISGRAATALTPRSYAVALDANGAIRGWSLVQTDGSYLIGSLPPGLKVRVRIGSDDDGDGVIGEVGEFVASTTAMTTVSRTITNAPDVPLGLSSGADQIRLDVRP
jgi:serine protease